MEESHIKKLVEVYIERMRETSGQIDALPNYPLDKESTFEVRSLTKDLFFEGSKTGVISGRFIDVIACAVQKPSFLKDSITSRYTLGDGYIKEVRPTPKKLYLNDLIGKI